MGLGTDAPAGYCTEGYGSFRCADPINCTAITGEVSCCEYSREVVESKLSRGGCGFRLNEASRTCLTSITCSPLSTHYMAILPISRSHLPNPSFIVAPHVSTRVDSTVRETQTQTATQEATAPTTTSSATIYTAATPLTLTAASPSVSITVSSPTLTTAIATVSPRSSTTSLSFDDVQGHKPMEGSTIGGTIVGVIAGGSLLILVLYLLFRRWKTRRANCNPKIRGVLAGPRIPTGSTVPASVYRRDGSDGWHTLPKSESSHPGGGDLEASVEQHDVGLQYYSESAHSQIDGQASSRRTAKERSSAIVEDNLTPSGSPARQSLAPISPPWSAENESSTLHSRRSNATIHWPLPKSTVSSPALLMNAREPPTISPLSPLSPFGDYDTVKAEVEEHIEKEQHRQDAYKKLSGEISDAALTKKPGSVSRARQNMTAAHEAPKKPGSVARARQNIEAARGATEQPRREIGARQNMGALRDFIRELDAQCGDEEINETGTVIRRKSKRAY
ncbi:hypothetical protein P171DRAFT_491221 [Karstenula rhodostoma CBS 690.94]|uniref:Uncharacterized protein n=1 Tax=Karstenula rhodostoma CBS 690.94 TaxID=1392251 RepID=A0A9P4U6W3_9PLEO|nr:hypothetical protein P171DRAFT_491221 [Karstenula rhodostoma CBS 690.94]